MTKILFVCLGNICRSPMAGFALKDLVKKAGCADKFSIASAAASTWKIGNPVYLAAREMLRQHGICCKGKTARQMTREDYANYDPLIGMNEANLEDMREICSGDPDHKICIRMDFTSRPGSVTAPYFVQDFTATWNDVTEGCEGLLHQPQYQH